MSKVQKEAEKYKDSSPKELKKVIRSYKRLLLSSNSDVNFLLSFVSSSFFFLIFCKINLFTVVFFICLHYFVVWKYFIVGKNLFLVSPEDGEEIKEVIEILESYLENQETKNPSE